MKSMQVSIWCLTGLHSHWQYIGFPFLSIFIHAFNLPCSFVIGILTSNSTLWFWLAFAWWLTMLRIFPRCCWTFEWLLLRNIYWGPLPISNDFYLISCMYVMEGTCYGTNMEVRGQIYGVSFHHYVGSGDVAQVSKLAQQVPYLHWGIAALIFAWFYICFVCVF